jgi:hypothetical protein
MARPLSRGQLLGAHKSWIALTFLAWFGPARAAHHAARPPERRRERPIFFPARSVRPDNALPDNARPDTALRSPHVPGSRVPGRHRARSMTMTDATPGSSHVPTRPRAKEQAAARAEDRRAGPIGRPARLPGMGPGKSNPKGVNEARQISMSAQSAYRLEHHLVKRLGAETPIRIARRPRGPEVGATGARAAHP